MLDIIPTDLTFYLGLYVLSLLASLFGLLSRLETEHAHKRDSLQYVANIITRKEREDKKEHESREVFAKLSSEVRNVVMDRLKPALDKYGIDADEEMASGETIGNVLFNMDREIAFSERIIDRARAATKGKQLLKGLSDFEKIIDEEIREEIENTIEAHIEEFKDEDIDDREEISVTELLDEWDWSRHEILKGLDGLELTDDKPPLEKAQDVIRHEMNQPVLGSPTPWSRWDFTKLFLKYTVFKPALYMTVLIVIGVFTREF